MVCVYANEEIYCHRRRHENLEKIEGKKSGWQDKAKQRNKNFCAVDLLFSGGTEDDRAGKELKFFINKMGHPGIAHVGI